MAMREAVPGPEAATQVSPVPEVTMEAFTGPGAAKA